MIRIHSIRWLLKRCQDWKKWAKNGVLASQGATWDTEYIKNDRLEDPRAIYRGVMCLRSRRRVKIWTEFHWLMQVTWPVFCDLIGGEGELHWVIWKEVTQNGCFGLNNPFLRHFWRKSSCFLCSSQQCLCKAYTQYHHQRALFQNRTTLF